jgi:hypothetical protein
VPKKSELQKKIRDLHREGWRFTFEKKGKRIYIRAMKKIEGVREKRSVGPYCDAAEDVLINIGRPLPKKSRA